MQKMQYKEKIVDIPVQKQMQYIEKIVDVPVQKQSEGSSGYQGSAAE